MRTKQTIIVLTIQLLIITISGIDSAHATENSKRKPNNYNIILDLSDRVLNKHQVEKDMALIEETFIHFETQARRGLILISKDRFSVKIIPQQGSPLDMEYYENLLQINLDEINVKDKNLKLKAFSLSIKNTLLELAKSCKYGKNSRDYFGVDIWSFLNNKGAVFNKSGYDNVALIITDGYFDFESKNHVLKFKNRSTSTQFLKHLNGFDWQTKAEHDDYGLIPIQLSTNVTWIVSSIQSKNNLDILQTKKIAFFWKKWLIESGANNYHFILNSSEKEMTSQLLAML